jgi:hypothetical protein
MVRELRFVGTRFLTLLVMAFVMGSCTDSGIFVAVRDEAPRIEILTIETGTVIDRDDTISIELVFDGDELEVDLMEIALYGADENALVSLSFGPDEIEALPAPVELPADLETGAYRFVVSLYLAGELVAEKTSEIYVAAEPHVITGVVPFPAIFYPGGKALLVAGIDVPATSDPFLRWRTPAGTIVEGRLSDGFDMVEIDVPAREGVFSLSLELFPMSDGPATTPMYELLSTNRLEMQFFASFNQPDEPHELGPAENYTALFHFRGESIDRGRDSTGDNPIGLSSFAIADESFGVGIGEYPAAVVDRSLFPLGETGMRPCTVSIRGVFFEYGPILSVRDADGARFAEIGVSSSGAPFLTFGEVVSSSVDAVSVPLGVTVELSVSIVPEESHYRVIWFLSGYLVDESVVTVPDDLELPSRPHTIIGGETAAVAVIDELGVFSVVTEDVDSAIFARAMKLEYGSDLLFAEGFDGLEFPAAITVDGIEEPDPIPVSSGVARVPSAARLELPPIPIDFESLRVEVRAAAGDDSISAYLEMQSSPSLGRILRFETDEGYLTSDGTIPVPEETGSAILVEITITDGDVSLVSTEERHTLTAVPDTDATLVISIGATGDEPISIDTILITKNRIESAD